MTKYRKHHPHSSVARTMLPRHMGGRGLVDIENYRVKQVETLRQYFHGAAQTSDLHEAMCVADESTPLRLSEHDLSLTHTSDLTRFNDWMGKALHGRHPNEMSQDHVDMEASNYWLISGVLFPETEGFMMAIQDQVIPTRNYLKFIANDPSVTDDSCRYGCRTHESIQHVTGGCTSLANSKYTDRHNSVAKILHQELARKYGLVSGKLLPYYEYQPSNVLENENWILTWDRTILTDQTVEANRPDIVLKDKKKKKVWLIDVAIPNNNNLKAKHAEKLSKYSQLAIAIRQQWGMVSVRTLPVVISSTGLIPRELHKSLKELEVNEKLWRPMQKAVILSTTRIVRGFLGEEY